MTVCTWIQIKFMKYIKSFIQVRYLFNQRPTGLFEIFPSFIRPASPVASRARSAMSISSHWDPTFEGLVSDEVEAFRRFLSTLNLDNLALIAVEVRGAGAITCRIDPLVFQRGTSNVVFELLFSDGVSWVARIRLPPSAWLHSVNEATQLAQHDIAQSEIDVLRYIKSRTSIPVPTIFHYDLNENGNSVGAAYILMEGFKGDITPSVFS